MIVFGCCLCLLVACALWVSLCGVVSGRFFCALLLLFCVYFIVFVGAPFRVFCFCVVDKRLNYGHLWIGVFVPEVGCFGALCYRVCCNNDIFIESLISLLLL